MALSYGIFICLCVCVVHTLHPDMKHYATIKMSQIENFLPVELLHIKTEIVDAFTSFKKKFNKIYISTEEELERFWKFVVNYGKIVLHNNRKNNSFDMELNRFADMDLDEIRNVMNGLDLSVTLPDLYPEAKDYATLNASNLPLSIDWRKLGAVTSVKDQGECGSCYAFSTTGALEGQHFRKYGRLVSLSEQQLVSCNRRTNGCRGGIMTRSFQYIKKYGIESENEYPYKAEKQKCMYNKTRVAARLSSYVNLPHDENVMKEAVARFGPLSIGIDSRCHSFMFYKSGIYDDTCCSSWRLTHAVLIVGYGVSEDQKPYWIIKNSWGSDWGDKGYVRMARGINQCGVNVAPCFPIV